MSQKFKDRNFQNLFETIFQNHQIFKVEKLSEKKHTQLLSKKKFLAFLESQIKSGN